MATGFYTAASGMLMQQRSLNVIANNMANASTPGYKTERVVSTTFEQEFLVRQEGYKKTYIGTGDAVKIVEDVPTNFDESYVKTTDRPFDMAIMGEGYYMIKDSADRLYLTRNGHFDVDEEGYLVLPGMGRVQGSRGDIKVGGSDFTIDGEGEIYNSKDRRVGKLNIIGVTEGTQLEKFANGMYQIPEGPEFEEIGDVPGIYEMRTFTIKQGALENSNTDFNREMALLIETQRAFQSCSKALMMVDEIEQKAANIGSL